MDCLKYNSCRHLFGRDACLSRLLSSRPPIKSSMFLRITRHGCMALHINQPIISRFRAMRSPSTPLHALSPQNDTHRYEIIQSIASTLPISEILPSFLNTLNASNSLILQAPPGAGKTTVCPLALLLSHPSFLQSSSNRILVLEPRRVAAKGAARRMASLLGER